MNAPAPAATTPKHLWIVGVLAFLWNCIGAFDYLMYETRNAEYLKAFTPEQLAYFDAFPMWAISSWALSVWGGVAGAMLLLMRKRLAVPVYLVSLVTFVITAVHNLVLTDGAAMMGGNGLYYFDAVIFLIALGLWLYARKMAAAGVLR